MKSFTIATIQMQVSPARATNLARAAELVVAAARDGAGLVVLPEMFPCPFDLEQFRPNAERLPDGPIASLLAGLADRLGIHIVGGSLPELDGDEVYNTATLWGPSGELLLKHRKVHLFDVDIPGGITFRESQALSAGDGIATAQCELGRIGLAVCFDLRFPECFRIMAVAGAELIVVPGAFNTTTGPMHWEPLVRTRAIENTCYLAACSPAPHPEVAYPAWGHSMIVDPAGRILAEAGREEATLSAALEAERLEEARRAIPVLEQRRPEVYQRAMSEGAPR
jgi:predicted amidohydrolase